jgi:AraC family transcriptional regulator, transcriptional activator of pobA
MKSVPNFALYGSTEAQPAWADLVHFERIPERSSRFDWEIDLHFHDALIQVLYITRGGMGEAFIDEVRWTLQPPCLIVVPARSVHGFHFHRQIDGPVITAAQKPLESLAAVAAPELLRSIRKPAVLAVDPASRHAEALQPLFDAIERESLTHATGHVAAGMALLVAVFVQIARIAEVALPVAETARSRKAAQIERFRALLDARFKQREPIQRYAGALGISVGQLTRLCRDVLGMSAQDAVNARVVHEAQRELVYSSLGIKQVAAELGFDDEAYFGRFFKKQTGYRPTEFREMARRQLAAA